MTEPQTTIRPLTLSGDEPTLLFLHLPKTAGGTLAYILRHLYPPALSHGMYDSRLPRLFVELPEEQQSTYRLVQGHFAYGLHESLKRPYRQVTVLRRPVERVLSLYYFVRSAPGHYLHTQVNEQQIGLEEFVSSDLSGEVSNFQTRALAGAKWMEDGEPADRATLELAKQNLHHFDAVGLTEAFDETLALFSRTLNWGFASRFFLYVNQNVAEARPPREQIPEHVRAIIEERNALDIELYDYAKALFEERVAQQSYPVALDVELIRLLRERYQTAPGQTAIWDAWAAYLDQAFGITKTEHADVQPAEPVETPEPAKAAPKRLGWVKLLGLSGGTDKES